LFFLGTKECVSSFKYDSLYCSKSCVPLIAETSITASRKTLDIRYCESRKAKMFTTSVFSGVSCQFSAHNLAQGLAIVWRMQDAKFVIGQIRRECKLHCRNWFVISGKDIIFFPIGTKFHCKKIVIFQSNWFIASSDLPMEAKIFGWINVKSMEQKSLLTSNTRV